MLMQYGAGLLIVKPEDDEDDKVKESVIGRVIKAKELERNTHIDVQRPAESLEAEIKKRQENDFEQQVEEQVGAKAAMVYKQSHFFVVCVGMALMFLVVVQFSYTTIFQDNAVLFLVIFMFVSIALEYILINFVLGEALLVMPILRYHSIVFHDPT